MQSAAFLKWSWITDRQLTLLRRDADIEVHSGPMLIIYEKDGGEGWIRTSVRLRGQIYSLLPLTTRPPLHEACHAAGPRTGEHGEQARHVTAHHCCVNAGKDDDLSPLARSSHTPIPRTG